MIKINESNVTRMVKDLNTSIRFYESIGIKLKQKWNDHYAMIGTTGITIGLHPSARKKLGSGTLSVGFMIDSLQEAIRILENTGISYNLDDGKSGKYIHFKDPDGTILYFVEPKWDKDPSDKIG